MSAGDCGKALLLQAEFDTELDAAQSTALAEHLATCPACQERWATLTSAREALRDATRHRASPQLRRAVSQAAGSSGRRARELKRAPWREIASFSAGAAIAAAIVLSLLPSGSPGIVASLVDDHVRALQPGHLIDVVSTSQHTVKPWFDGKLDFSPPVKNLAVEGYPLIGGRLDYLRGHAVAALVYSRGKHVIDLYVWPPSVGITLPAGAEHDGYHVVHWTAQGMSLTAVSDVDPDALHQFMRDWQRSP
jgi:anti-sigma factor RsiW